VLLLITTQLRLQRLKNLKLFESKQQIKVIFKAYPTFNTLRMILSGASTNGNEDNESNVSIPASMITSSRKRKLDHENITPWQRGYVNSHVTQGHIGFCYAWLDLAYCPQAVLLSKCCYKHEYPSAWTEEMKIKHAKKLTMMSYLWKEASLEECFKKPKRTSLELTSLDSDNASENDYIGDDSSSDYGSDYSDDNELEIPLYSSATSSKCILTEEQRMSAA
jgi:hypothetical protein